MSTESTFVPTNHFWVASLQDWVEYEEIIHLVELTRETPLGPARYQVTFRPPNSSEHKHELIESLAYHHLKTPNLLIRAASKTLEAA